jgi:hypothetical protein
LEGQQLELEINASYSQGWEGLIVKFGTNTLAANKVYNYTSSGWIASRATSDTNTKGLIGIALGTDADVDGVLVKGIYTSTAWSGFSAGDILYLSTTSGVMTSTAPTTSGAFVRVLGYALGSNTIYINPSPDYIEVA